MHHQQQQEYINKTAKDWAASRAYADEWGKRDEMLFQRGTEYGKAAIDATNAQNLEILKGQIEGGVYPGIPGKAEIAGETAKLKKVYGTNGTPMFVPENVDQYHTYTKAADHADFRKDPSDPTKTLEITLPAGTLGSVGLLDTDPNKKGWHQIENESFLKNWKKDHNIGPGQYQGRISIKDGKMIVGVLGLVSGETKPTWIRVTGQSLFASEKNYAGAKEKPLMQNPDEAASGSYATAPTPQARPKIIGKVTYADYPAYKKAYEAAAGKLSAADEPQLIERWNALK